MNDTINEGFIHFFQLFFFKEMKKMEFEQLLKIYRFTKISWNPFFFFEIPERILLSSSRGIECFMIFDKNQ